MKDRIIKQLIIDDSACIDLPLTSGTCDEVAEGMVRIYDRNNYPIIEVYGVRNIKGRLLEENTDIQKIADYICQLVNGE